MKSKTGKLTAGAISLLVLATVHAEARQEVSGQDNVTIVRGSEHPERFSRRIAFQIAVRLLEIHPDNPLSDQRRARSIERDRIGLTPVDAALLETVVEGVRVREEALNSSVRTLSVDQLTADEKLQIARRRDQIFQNASYALTTGLTPGGLTNLRKFLAEIISKSELRIRPVPGGSKQ